MKQVTDTIVGMRRRIEVWRNGELIDVDEGCVDWKDLVTTAGLNAACGALFDSSGSRPAAFTYIAIGTDNDPAPAAGDTALNAEVMREAASYEKDVNAGEASIDATFSIDGTYALVECGILNDASVGTLYCRDIFTVKNVEDGDTVNVYYTAKFQVPA